MRDSTPNPTSKTWNRSERVLVALLILTLLVALFFPSIVLPIGPAFLATVMTLTAATNLATFFLLTGIYRNRPRPATAVLASTCLTLGVLEFAFAYTTGLSNIALRVRNAVPPQHAGTLDAAVLATAIGGLIYAWFRTNRRKAGDLRRATAFAAASTCIAIVTVLITLWLCYVLPVSPLAAQLVTLGTTALTVFSFLDPIIVAIATFQVLRIPRSSPTDRALSIALVAIFVESLLTASPLVHYSIPWATAQLSFLLASVYLLYAMLKELLNSDRRGSQALDMYRLLAERTNDAIMFVDASDRKIIAINEATLRAYGYTREELIGASAQIFRSAASHGPSLLQYPESELRAGVLFEIEHQRKDGSTFPVSVTAKLTEFDARRILCIVVRDISKQREDQAALARALNESIDALRFKSDFSATLSHEIRTPVNVLVGMSELLLRTNLDGHQHELARTIGDASHSLLTLLNDVLDLSKIEAGRMGFERVEFDTIRTLDDAVTMFRDAAAAKHIGLELVISPLVPLEAKGDPTRLRQVLLNLISNAVKFTDSGKITVGVELRTLADTEFELEVSVTDTGIGIPEPHDHLFEPFRQVDASTTRRYGGSGLGLAIAHRLVALMGGALRYRPNPNGGSIFSFTLLLGRSETSTPTLLQHDQLAGLRILIVEDDPVSAESVRACITQWGARCVIVGDATAAANALASAYASHAPYELVLIDNILPRIGGIALGQAVKARPNHYGNPRLVLMSGVIGESTRELARAAGFVDFLAKPIVPAQLYGLLRDAKRAEPLRPQAVESAKATRILVVDDQPTNRRTLSLQLRALGYSSDEASDGEAAIAAIERTPYDLVFMDVRMPKLDGIAATRKIREMENLSGRHTTIIALTANAEERDRNACLASGMDDYLAKPLTMQSLTAALERWVEYKADAPSPVEILK